MTVDFGLVRNSDGALTPKLVELQAFPSIFGYQDILARQYIETYNLDPNLTWHLGNLNEQTYWQLLREVIVGDHDPENVVLLEIDPDHQKTLPDFHVYEDKLHIATVDITQLRKQGNRLFYHRDGQVRELKSPSTASTTAPSSTSSSAKTSSSRSTTAIPSTSSGPAIPTGTSASANSPSPTSTTPPSPKPSSSMTGSRSETSTVFRRNAKISSSNLSTPSQARESSSPQPTPTSTPSPRQNRHLYLLQERVSFEPVIDTPHGPTQAEIRIMYLWPDGGSLQPAIALVRLGRGLMMGVDHNRDRQWVGSSAALTPPL